MNSGGHPAMTPLTATWRTVAARCAGGIAPSGASGGKSVKRRNSATASGVGGTTGRPSDQPESRKIPWISASVPLATGSSAAGGRASPRAAAAGDGRPPSSPSFTCGHSTRRVFSSSSSRVWLANAPGYSATRSSARPADAAVLRACSTNPGPAIITDGIPSASAAMHDPVSLGVHSPHPPLPDTTASTPSARRRRWNSSFSRRTTPGRG